MTEEPTPPQSHEPQDPPPAAVPSASELKMKTENFSFYTQSGKSIFKAGAPSQPEDTATLQDLEELASSPDTDD